MFIPFLPSELTFVKKLSWQAPPNVYFFQQGRQALRVGFDILSLPKGSTILMPCSLCSVIIKTILDYGLKIKLYPLDIKMSWNIDIISNLITEDVSAVYVIHYFGLWNDLKNLKILCEKNNVKLIEDCALCGFETDSPVGRIGDISIFSMWKFLPIPDGGMLVVNQKNIQNENEVYSPPPNHNNI